MPIEQVNSRTTPPRTGAAAPRANNPGPKAAAPRDANAATGAAATLARLAAGTPFDQITPAAWHALARELLVSGPERVAALQRDLVKKGVQIVAQPEVDQVSVLMESGATSIDTRKHTLRVTTAEGSKLYEGEKQVGTVSYKGDNVILKQDGQTQSWNLQTGRGTLNGKAIAPRWADPVPGEAPRKPRAVEPTRLAEPPEDDASPADVARLYNAAVRATGGEVLEASRWDDNEATQYNCHSFAVTDTRGDLLDPFGQPYQSRWLNFPNYQFAFGPFKQLEPEQRVHVGDVVVYQKDGINAHTGIVRAVDQDGNPTRIESKWGTYGRYLHNPYDVPSVYGQIGAVYRPEGKP